MLSPQTSDEMGLLRRLEGIVSPYGIVANVHSAPALRHFPQLVRYSASFALAERPRDARTYGRWAYGKAFDRDEAKMISLCEAVERYSALPRRGEKMREGSFDSFDGETFPIANLPRCSETEFGNPACPLSPLSSADRIRWIEGTDLSQNRPRWVPAVMATYALHPWATENFWYRISTGFAVHSDPEEATLRAIFEVIERDAMALTWLQQLPIPQIPRSRMNLWDSTLAIIRRCDDHYLTVRLFDATTDTKVPTALCLLTSEHSETLHNWLGTATARTLAEAAEKSILDTLGSRPPIGVPEVKSSYEEFNDISDGAFFMGRREMAEAFTFLTDAPTAERPPGDLAQGVHEALADVLRNLSCLGISPIIVDRTRPEIASLGLTAVNAVIPGLMPMSLHPLAQYRGTARLYDAPRNLGYQCHPEEGLNPWPIPYA